MRIEHHRKQAYCTHVWLGVCIFLLPCFTAFRISAGEPVNTVVEAWQLRQEQLRSVRFRASGKCWKPRGYMQMPRILRAEAQGFAVPAQDHTEPIHSEVTLDLERGRLLRHQIHETYTWISGSDDAQFFPFDELVVFDGQHFKAYRPYERNHAKAPEQSYATELSIYAAGPRTIVFGLELNPLLYACGIIHTDLNHNPANLRPELDPGQFKLEGEASLDGHPCLILRSVPDPRQRFYEFWVDRDDHRMIRQSLGYGLNQKAELWVTTRIEYRDTPHGPMPDTWTVERIEHSTGKVALYSMKLDEFEANPRVTDADFDIVPPPGTLVYDERRPKAERKFVVAGAGQPDLPPEAFIKHKTQPRSRGWAYAGIGALVAAIAAAILFRRRSASV